MARNRDSELQEIEVVRNQDSSLNQSSFRLDHIAFPSFSIIFKILKNIVNLVTNFKTIFYLQILKQFF